MINQSWLDEQIYRLVKRQEDISNRVVGIISKRISEIGSLETKDINMLQNLYRSGADVREINNLIAINTNMQVKDIKKIIKMSAFDIYADVKPFYDYRHKSYIPFKDNKPLQRVVNAIAEETSNSFKNISNSKAIGFTMTDRKTNTLKFKPMKTAYQNVIDNAIQTLAFGVEDFDTVMTRTLAQLTKSGVQGLYWDSGYHQRLDTAVRRNILEGVNKVNIEVELQLAKVLGTNGVELSAHPMSAPDHEPIQGHCFTNEEFRKLQDDKNFEDIKGNKYDAIARPIGAWNCRHYIHNVITEIYTPQYTSKQLQDWIDANKEGYTDSKGRHYSLYECTQIQRKMETDIRRLKDKYIAVKHLKNKDLSNSISGKILEKTNEYKMFCKQAGLQADMSRLNVIGY